MPSSKRSSKVSKKKGGSKKEKEETRPTTSGAATVTRFVLVFLSFFVAVFAVLAVEKNSENSKDSSSEIIVEAIEPVEKWARPEPPIAFLLGQACRVAYCHDAIKAVKRSLRATRRIQPGEKLFEIPRSMQIWDLDALRDPFVREHLFKVSHRLTGNQLGSEALLAAHLALQMKESQIDHSNMDPLRLAYFDVLPKLKDLMKFHPVLRNTSHVRELLGRSEAHAVVQGYRNMLVSEWEAFTTASPEFVERVNKADYFVARLNVLTRAVRTGPPGPEEVIGAGSFLSDALEEEDLLKDELEAYKDLLGIDLMKDGCIALIPIADLFNHHPMNNVEFTYENKENSKGSFVVTADHRNIEEGFEPMASYGILTDAQLYARYGFVNGDGSGPTQVSIAFHHDVLRLNISAQYDYLPKTGTTGKLREFHEKKVAQYLKYDDGYVECIPGKVSHPQEAELKRLKWEHLLKIANDVEKWTMSMPPRNPYSYPNTNTSTQITLEPPQFIRDYVLENYNMDKIQETCRLISLINTDFDGRAVDVLTENLKNDTFVVGPGSDDLEFRSFMCIGRWMGTRLVSMELTGTLRSEFDHIQKLNTEEFGSQNWTTFHVRFGEMQAVQAASNLIFERVNEHWIDKKYDAAPEYTMRDDPCPDEYMDYLFDSERR